MDEINYLNEVYGDVSNLALPIPVVRNYYRDEKERNFYVDGLINVQTEENDPWVDLMELNKMIIRCNKEDKGKDVQDRIPIKVWIDSCGGDVTSTWSVINLINMSKTPVYTICYRQACSAGAELLASGHKRYSFPGCTGMVHLGSCGYGGDQMTVEVTKKYFDKMNKSMVDYFLSKTKIDPKVFKKKTVTDWYMNENEMLENGLIDEIVIDIDEII